MNIIYKNDELIVSEIDSVEEMEEKVFSILDGFGIDKVTLKTNKNKKSFESFKNNFYKNYNGILKIE